MLTRKQLLLSLATILILLAMVRFTLAGPLGSDPLWGETSSQLADGRSVVKDPVGTAFTYQGRLSDESGPVNGLYDFRFALSDSATDGDILGQSVHVEDVEVVDGAFTAVLDFGDFYDGRMLWLLVAVRPDGDGEFIELEPRQPLTAAPLASFASQAPWSGLLGMPEEFADGRDDNTTYEPGAGLLLNIRRFDLLFGGSGGEQSVARSDHDHYGQEWIGRGSFSGLTVSNDTVGIQGVSNQSTGVWGRAMGTSGDLVGVYGQSHSPDGAGVRASNTQEGADLELGGFYGDLISDRSADNSDLRLFSEGQIGCQLS